MASDRVRLNVAGQSDGAFGHVIDHPLETLIDTPVNLQLVGSDSSGTHAVATLGGLIFDAAETRVLPL